MSRALVIAVFALLVLAMSGVVMLYLAYGLTDRPSEHASMAGLSDSVQIELYGDASARIRASDAADAYAALGYLHAQEHGWAMALYRRTAIGRLSEWFGDELLEIDRLALRLELGRRAREAYATLPEDRKRVLVAYARGVNATWERRRGAMRDEFVLLDVQPRPWEPWHSMAVERLYAWMAAARPPADTLAEAGGDAASFFDADGLLRGLLHMHGFENSLAWTVRDSAEVRLFQRHVYGATALPLMQNVVLEWPDGTEISGGSLVGTPFIPAGRDEDRAWALLLSSPLSLDRAVRDTADVSPSFERLISADGEEHLLRFERTGREIFFEAPRPFFVASDTSAEGMRHGWILRWSGFNAATDTDAWLDLAERGAGEFRLFGGDGLLLRRDGSTTVLGGPDVSIQIDGGFLVSNSPWGEHVAERLGTLLTTDRDPPDLANVHNDRMSAWAAELAPRMTRDAIAVPNQPAAVTEALAFLRNWDFAYDRASIAASIFETWLATYEDSLGRHPEPLIPDSTIGEVLTRYELLVRAVERLASAHGENLSQWRWEDIQPKRYFFPIFSADTLLSLEAGPAPRTRYAPIDIPGAGHPSTLFWGPTFLESAPPSPATWAASLSTGDWQTLQVQAQRFRASRFFGRYLVSDRPPEAAALAARDRHERTLLLLP